MIIKFSWNIRHIEKGLPIYITLKSRSEKNLNKILNFYKNKIGYMFISSTVYHDNKDWWV